jgi:hypothetical protein
MADLVRFPELNADDSRVATFVFEYVQFLLDDDANLTPTGNLTGAARQKLRGRLNELLADDEGDAGPKSAADDELTAAILAATQGPGGPS